MIFKTFPQVSHLCFLKIHKFFIYSSWKLKIIFKTFATNFTFIIFMSHTLSWDRKNLFLYLFIYFPLLELENSLFSSSRARKQIFRPPNYEFLLFCMEWKLNNYKGKKNNSGFLLSSPCAIMEDLNREIGWRDYCDRHIIGELKGK